MHPGKHSRIRRLRFEQLEGRQLLAVGELDASFGDGGVVVAPYVLGSRSEDTVTDVAIQQDDKIVEVGMVSTSSSIVLGMTRFNADGTVDDTFGAAGRVLEQIGGGFLRQASVAIQADNKILVAAGDLSLAVHLRRYNSDGSPDVSFGDNGIVTHTGGGFFVNVADMLIQPDGKIVVVGSSTSNDFLFLSRFQANGDLDESFAGGGTAFLSLSDYSVESQAVARQANGALIVAGNATPNNESHLPQPSRLVFAARFTDTGVQDATFDEDGLQTIPLGTRPSVDAAARVYLTVRDDDRLVLGTSVKLASDPFETSEVGVLQLLADGARDASFGSTGVQLIDPSPGYGDQLGGILALPNGETIIVGVGNAPPGNYTRDARLARLDAGGNVDAALFGQRGFAPVFIDPNYEITGVGIQSTGTVVVAHSYPDFGLTLVDGLSFNIVAEREGSPVNFVDGQSDVSGDSVAVDARGSVSVAANCQSEVTSQDTCLYRFQPDGMPDSQFGDAGVTRIGRYVGGRRFVLPQPSGQLLVVSSHGNGFEPSFMDLALVDRHGTPVQSFGTDGFSAVELGAGYHYVDKIEMLVDGRLLALVSAEDTGKRLFKLFQFDKSRNLDQSFGTAGVLTVVDDGSLGTPIILVQADGRITVLHLAAGNSGPVLVGNRYLSNGQPDPTWGASGVVTVPLPTANSPVNWCSDAAFARDASIFVVCASGSESYFVGLTADGLLNTAFGNAGIAVRTARGMPDYSNFETIHLSGLPDDGFVVTGIQTGTVTQGIAQFFDANGSPIQQIGSDGAITLSTWANGNGLGDIALDGAGHLYVIGAVEDISNTSLLVAKLQVGWRAIRLDQPYSTPGCEQRRCSCRLRGRRTGDHQCSERQHGS